MRRENKTCICCGKKYEFCLNCAEYDHLPRWMNIWHNENCKNLFDITTEYLAGNITSEKAKEEFAKCDLSYKNELHESIINAINEVNKRNKKIAVSKEKTVEDKK